MNWLIQAYTTDDGQFKVSRAKDGSWTLITPYAIQSGFDIQTGGIATAEAINQQNITSILNLKVNGVFLGVYDYRQTFTSANTMSYEECWTYYNTFTPGSVTAQLNAILARNRTPILVIEPWNILSIGGTTTLLADITAGKYDTILHNIGVDIGTYGGPVFIRWGEKMDGPSSSYPWAGQSPAQYIAAFQHVVTLLRGLLVSFNQYMWSPTINDTVTAPTYYPGDAYVDVVGMSVYEFLPYSVGVYGVAQTFAALMNWKYPVISGYAKPIFIEGGASTLDDQISWVHGAFSTFQNYPLLQAFIWFNAPDVPWGSYGTPDFSISPTVWMTA